MPSIPTRQEIALSLWSVTNDAKAWETATRSQKAPILKQADVVRAELERIKDESFMAGFSEGVSGAQYMAGLTDETVQAIYEKEGFEMKDDYS